jgi:hypothetical protein
MGGRCGRRACESGERERHDGARQQETAGTPAIADHSEHGD